MTTMRSLIRVLGDAMEWVDEGKTVTGVSEKSRKQETHHRKLKMDKDIKDETQQNSHPEKFASTTNMIPIPIALVLDNVP
jgi:hypothetical protein